MSRKRVVIFGWASSVHVQRWAKGLKSRGYDIKVISSGGEKIDGIETVILPYKNKLSYYFNRSLAKAEALNFNPDIVHVHYAGGFGLWGLSTNISPTVVSVWGSDIEKLTNNFLLKMIVKKTLKKAAVVTATSGYLKNETERILTGCKSKLEIIPFGVTVSSDVKAFPSEEPIKICYIKGDRFVYGPDVLLEALAIVKKEMPDVQLSMAGSYEKTGLLEEMIKDLNLSVNVKIVGFIDNSKMYDFISQHHLMAMPSRREGFGVAVLEASACGRPVIATKVGGVPEVLIDGKTGLLVPSEDENKLAEAILRLAKDSNLMRKMGQAGYEFVKDNYDWELSLDKMTALYERLSDGEN